MGQLIRLLLLALAIWLVIGLLRRLLANVRGARRAAAKPPAVGGVPMLPCAHCGVFVPEDEAVSAHGKVYCSRRHAAADHRP
ncbi:MAG TPA: PP0621 family protein [Acidiferrobacterales bacterium]